MGVINYAKKILNSAAFAIIGQVMQNDEKNYCIYSHHILTVNAGGLPANPYAGYVKYSDSFDSFHTWMQVVAYTKSEEEFNQYFEQIHKLRNCISSRIFITLMKEQIISKLLMIRPESSRLKWIRKLLVDSFLQRGISVQAAR